MILRYCHMLQQQSHGRLYIFREIQHQHSLDSSTHTIWQLEQWTSCRYTKIHLDSSQVICNSPVQKISIDSRFCWAELSSIISSFIQDGVEICFVKYALISDDVEFLSAISIFFPDDKEVCPVVFAFISDNVEFFSSFS